MSNTLFSSTGSGLPSARISSRRALVSSMALCGLLALGACGGKDENKAEEPAELVGFTESLKVRRAWSARVGDESESLRLGLAPASDGTRVYAAAHDGKVVAFDGSSGERLWRIEAERAFSAGPAWGEGKLALGSSDGDLTLLNADDGTEIWSRNIGSEVLASPLVVRGLVVVRTVDGRLRGFEQSNGDERWTMRREVPALTLRGNSAPAVAGDKVIAAFDDGVLVALDIASGDPIWESSVASQRGRTVIERLADVDADVLAAGNDIYVLGYQSRAAMISAESGQVLWSSEHSGFEPPGADWSRLYITDAESEVVAMDRQTGAEMWRQSGLRLRRTSGPVAFGNNVVVGDYEGYLHWLGRDDGTFKARVRAGGEAVSNPPLVVGEMLYVQTDGGEISAYVLPQDTPNG